MPVNDAPLVIPTDLSAALDTRVAPLLRWLRHGQGPRMILLKTTVTWGDRELALTLDCYDGGTGGLILLEAPVSRELLPEEPFALVLALVRGGAEVWTITLGNVSCCVGFHVKVSEPQPKEALLPEGWQE